jgi:regulatory protein
LEEQGFEAATAATAVAELLDGRILDDARYAENYVNYHAQRGQGPVRITMDLRALGLSDELIETALAAGPDWRALAREVRIRKFGLEQPGSWAQKGRQARFLQYRGFSSDHIRLAIGPDFDPDGQS